MGLLAGRLLDILWGLVRARHRADERERSRSAPGVVLSFEFGLALRESESVIIYIYACFLFCRFGKGFGFGVTLRCGGSRGGGLGPKGRNKGHRICARKVFSGVSTALLCCISSIIIIVIDCQSILTFSFFYILRS